MKAGKTDIDLYSKVKIIKCSKYKSLEGKEGIITHPFPCLVEPYVKKEKYIATILFRPGLISLIEGDIIEKIE
jgi:hypothetical protein